jgi:hypothetical protein
MITLREAIMVAISKKSGNTEFALFHDNGHWQAVIGNTCVHVSLGESEGEHSSGWHTTPEAALQALLERLP